METDRRRHAALGPYQPRLLHDVLDNLDTAVVVVGAASTVLAGNAAATRVLGVRRGRRAGDVPTGSVTLSDPEGRGPVDVLDFAFWRARAESGAPLTLRARRDGAPDRWLSATAHLVGEHTDAPAVVCRYADVTVARELERRAVATADHAARAEVDLVEAERRVALLEELLVQLATKERVSGF